MRPRLVKDFVWAAGDDLVEAHSNRGSFTIRGKHVAEWLGKLAVYLDGRRSLGALSDGLPQVQQDSLSKLVHTLAEHGVVHDLDTELEHGLSNAELARLWSEIDYVDSCQGSGAHRFERFYKRPIVFLGSPGIAETTAEFVRALGCHQVNVGNPETIDLDGLTASSVLVVAITEDVSLLTWLNRACRDKGLQFLPVAMLGEVAWIGPLVKDTMSACWECAWRRLNLPYADDVKPNSDLSSTALIASRVAFEAFAVTTGCGQDGVHDRVFRLDVQTGQGAWHRFHRHPLCEACGGGVGQEPLKMEVRWTAFVTESDGGTSDIMVRAEDIVDPHCGVLRDLGEGTVPQLPYRATNAIVSNPVQGRDPIIVCATAENLAESRVLVIKQALESYTRTIYEELLARATVPSLVWAWDILMEAPAPVPVNAMLASSAAGDSTQALAAALFELAARTVGLEDERVSRRIEIDLSAASLADPDIRWTSGVMSRIGLKPRIMDVTDEIGVPSVSAYLDGRCIAHTAAEDINRAIALALEAIVSHWQTVGETPRFCFEMPPISGDLPWRTLAIRLHDNGWRSLGILQDRDMAVHAVCPHLITVALAPTAESSS